MRIMLSTLCTVFVLAMAPASAAGIDVDVRFSSSEASIIRDFFQNADSTGQRGKKGRDRLPPGIEKNLARGKPLPPGIAKQALPNDLIRKLPPARDGYERVVVSGKVLLVEIATQVIHDILSDAILK